MKHKAYGKALLLGVFAIAGCYSYASDAINNENYHKVDAQPNFIVQKVGDSDRVIVRLINDANNSAITSFSVSAVGAGIRVDSSCTVPDLDQAHQVAASCNGYYRPVFSSSADTLVPTGAGDAQQFFVLGLAAGQYTFVLTPTSVNTGVSRTITVVITSADLGPALSKTSGVAGDTITLTAPSGSVFSTKSVVTFPTGQLAIASLSPDSTQLKFIAGPGITGPATVTLVGTAANPAADVATLVTTNTLTTPQVTVAPTTLSTGTPAFGAPITVTLGGGLRFTPSSTVTFGTIPAVIISTSADSSSAVVIPFGGITGGAVTYTDVVLSFLHTVNLNLPGDKSIAIGPPVADPLTNLLATAPTIVLPASGGNLVVSGAGPFNNAATECAGSTGDGCQLYKVVIADTTHSYDITLKASGGQDMGLYRINAAGTSATSAGSTGNCDASGQDAAPESCTMTLAPGTYFFAVVFFGTGSGYPPSADATPPTWYQFSVHTH